MKKEPEEHWATLKDTCWKLFPNIKVFLCGILWPDVWGGGKFPSVALGCSAPLTRMVFFSIAALNESVEQ